VFVTSRGLAHQKTWNSAIASTQEKQMSPIHVCRSVAGADLAAEGAAPTQGCSAAPAGVSASAPAPRARGMDDCPVPPQFVAGRRSGSGHVGGMATEHALQHLGPLRGSAMQPHMTPTPC
jgi:hypothetical protein